MHFSLHFKICKAFPQEPMWEADAPQHKPHLFLFLWPPASCLSTWIHLTAQLLPLFQAPLLPQSWHKCCVSSDPCGFPVIVQLPSAWALILTDSPHIFAVSLMPDFKTSLVLFAGLLPLLGALHVLEHGPIFPLTPPSIIDTHFLGLCPLSPPRRYTTLLHRRQSEV